MIDNADRVIFYVCVCAEPEQPKSMKRLSPLEALAAAQVAARTLTDRI
ncbi:hypothetical protein MKK68_24325 [Methylobacterium sp. E-016]|nr:hypothetical protein [Methylobacterium sp. E-016]MCJ2078731.1 hypothetical protein [Methylobacterium sp. E-016]